MDRGLVAIGRALGHPSEFDPKAARRSFTIASPDLFDVLAIPLLLQRMRDEAPRVDLAVAPVDGRRLSDQLETGEVDVAIVPQVDEVRTQGAEGGDSGLRRRTLVRDGFVCFVRQGHPCLSARRGKKAKGKAYAPLSLEDYAGLSHALVSPTGEGRGFVDELLEKRGLRRRIALRVALFHSALTIVAMSDLILTAPTPLGRLASTHLPVVAFEPPLTLPKHNVNMLWHERFSNDAGHKWLRDMLLELAPRLVEGS